jgi:predicted GNAT superfamily acetyltransferase
MLALNNAHAEELSLLRADALHRLLAGAFHARVIGDVAAFLVAFDERADYLSPNYRWFRDRYRRFVYVDRVVVAPEAGGRGYARLLYRDLFDTATRYGHELVGCEVNIDPPNRPSDAFHAALGFETVGEATLLQAAKRVRYLARSLAGSRDVESRKTLSGSK